MRRCKWNMPRLFWAEAYDFSTKCLTERESSAPSPPQIIRNLCRQAALLNTPPPPTLPNEGKLSCSHNYSIRWGTKVYISVFYEVSLGSCLWMCFLRKLRGNFSEEISCYDVNSLHFFFGPIFQLNRKPLLSVKHNSRVTEAETIINI